MATVQTRQEPARLHFQDGRVMITAMDQDIFFISAEKATEACRDVIRQEERVPRFTEEFLLPLAQWCEQHRDRIAACYVAMPQSAVLSVYAVGASERYDFDLTDKLSDLAFQFEDRGWSVHACQIPKCETEQLHGYFNPNQALQVHG